MTEPTKPSRKAGNVFVFRVLFQRSFIDDADAVGGMEKLTGGDGEMSRSLIDQLASEINLNPAFRNRFVFSPYIIFAGNEYYILGQITVNSPEKNSLEAWDTFLKEFQSTYDEYGMAGHFRIEPTDNQSDMRDWAKEDAWPVPPWSETPYVPPKLSEEITLVRIGLDGAKTVYWGWRASTEDYDDKPLDPTEALRLPPTTCRRRAAWKTSMDLGLARMNSSTSAFWPKVRAA